jgi:hypothetical protein
MIYFSNLKKDPFDERDYLFASTTYGLPESVDLRQYSGGIDDQGNVSSCTANAGTSALELLTKRTTGSYKELSRLFLYYNEREPYENLRGQDKGADMRSICKSLATEGICDESLWPYDVYRWSEKPSPDAYAQAATRKVTRYERVARDNNWALMKAALAKGYPVIIGMLVREPIFSMTGPLETHTDIMLKTNYANAAPVGQHAMLVVGYDDTKNIWIIENSWGSGFGDKGYWGYPYGTIFDYHLLDSWVITGFADLDMKDIWVAPPVVPMNIEVPESVTLQEPANITEVVPIKITGGNPPYKAVAVPIGNVGVQNIDAFKPVFTHIWTEGEGDFAVPVQITVSDSSMQTQILKATVTVNGKRYVAPVPVEPTPEPVPEPPKSPEPVPTPPAPAKNKKDNTPLIVGVVLLVIAALYFLK